MTKPQCFPEDGPLRERVKQIHQSGCSLVILASGGGAEALTKLTAIPGASAVLQEAAFPYSRESMTFHAGPTPETMIVDGIKRGGSVSEANARLMAHAAWVRASQLGKDKPAFGVGITAALASSRPHRTGERAFIAVQSGISGQDVFTGEVWFPRKHGECILKPDTDREVESYVVGATALWMLADHIRKPAPLDLDAAWFTWLGPVRRAFEYATGERRSIPANWPFVDVKDSGAGVVFGRDGTVKPAEQFLDPEKHYIYGGRFSPAHWGHFAAKLYLDRVTGKAGVFNLTKAHPNKGQVPSSAVVALLEACKGKVDVLLDEATCLYRDKAKRWKCDLAMGLDAFQGMLDQEPGDAQRIAASGSKIHILNRPGSAPRWNQIGTAIASDAARFYHDAIWQVSSTEVRSRRP